MEVTEIMKTDNTLLDKMLSEENLGLALAQVRRNRGACGIDGMEVSDLKDYLDEIIYVFLTIFLYLLKCPQSLILSALRAFCFCGKPHISRSIFLYFRYQAWLKSW